MFEFSKYNWFKLIWNINQCLVQGSISNVQSFWDSSCAIAAILLPTIFLAGTQVLGRLGSCPSLHQVGCKTTLENTNAALVTLNMSSWLSAVLLSPCHLCLELAVQQYWTSIFLRYVLPLWSEQLSLGSQSLLLFCFWDCDAVLMLWGTVVHLDHRTSLGCFRYFAHLRLTSLNSFCLLLL